MRHVLYSRIWNPEYGISDMLKSQDILVMLKLVAMGPHSWSYGQLSYELFMSPSQAHSAVKRALSAQLAVKVIGKIAPNIRNLEEFLVHGLKYVFVVERGEMTRGIPTGYAAPPMEELLFANFVEPPPVWPDPEGKVRGFAFSPLCKHAPQAALLDNKLYELLVLIDAIRGGQARERNIAVKELKKRLDQYAKIKQPQHRNIGNRS